MRHILLIFTALLAAQETGFNVQSRLVLVPVTVTSADGQSAEGLGTADFVLLDNGQPRQVVVDTIGTGVAPVALVIAVQSSGISAASLEKVRKVASMVQALVTGARGCAALLSFHSYIRMLQECTSDPDQLDSAFQRLQPGDPKSARMIDAVDTALEYLATRPNVRRVLLLISETRDRGSELELETAVIKAQSAGVAVYAITYSALKTGFTSKTASGVPEPPRPQVERPKGTETEPLSAQGRIRIPPPAQRVDLLGGITELIRLGKTKDTNVLAEATGGNTWSFTRDKGLQTAITRFGAELHSQYVLSFTPVNPEPGYHRLEVKVKDAGSKLQVRARPGYWAIQD